MSRYAHMDHAAWVQARIGKPLSPLGRKAAYIIGVTCGGIYNAQMNLDKSNFTDERWCEASLCTGEWATHDFCELTSVVLLACELGVRVAIRPSAPRYARLCFANGNDKSVSPYSHPTIDEAVSNFRGWSDEFADKVARSEQNVQND